MTSFHQLNMKLITGDDVDFQSYNGTLCLAVNLASR